MINRDNVISGLHCRAQDLIIDPPACDKCEYQVQLVNRAGCDFRRLCKDALELLKEQKLAKLIENRVICRTFDGERYLFGLATVTPEVHGSDEGTQYYVCNECKTPLSPGNDFCGGCGKLVNWND